MATNTATNPGLAATVEELEGSLVKLSITVPDAEFDKAITAAFRKIAQEVRIPGFRPGKAPRRLLESRLGAAVGREQALRDALPDYYAEAVIANKVDVIAAPEIEITAGHDHGDVEFTAVVEVRPVVHLVGYEGVRVTIPDPTVAEADVDSQVDALRGRFAELEDSEHPLIDGNFAVIDLTGSIDGEEADGLSASDFMIEVGSGSVLDELDVALRGKKTGDIVEFTAELPERFGDRAGATVDFRFLVKDTKNRVLPEPDDEFAQNASEFDTIDALRADVRRRIDTMRRVQAQMAVREKVLEEVADLVDIEPPAPLVSQEMQTRLEDMARRLQQQGVSFEQYMAATGTEPEQITNDLREAGERAVKIDLALRAVVVQEAIEVSDDEVDDELHRLAERLGRKVAEVRRNLERGGRLEAVRSDLAHGKAVAFLVDHASVVNEEGVELDLTIPEAPSTDTDPPSLEPTDEPSVDPSDDPATTTE